MAGKKTSNELKELTDKVINLVTKEFQVDEIILFGSYAKGTAKDLNFIREIKRTGKVLYSSL